MTSPEQRPMSAAVMQRALVTMERMQRRIDDYERARSEPIAIVGIGCRFPGGVTSTETYWDLLATGQDTITEIPADRWDVAAFYDEKPRQPGKMASRWGAFLEHIDRFDYEFFGISRREAMAMDPQQRLLLEVTWEALEDAGQPPLGLAGSDTGVFIGMWGTDYASHVFRNPAEITAYSSLGNAHSFAAGRISYLLDLHGPALTLDTACSSSLVAVHEACQSLRLGESDAAICGAVNAILAPQASISISQVAGSFVSDGRIKAFDAAADGFVRSEGCGVVVLKRLSDAQRDGDQVHAVIHGSAINQDGRGSALTAPNGAAQRAVLRRALRAGGIEPDQVDLIETHGTGTRLGDPIEADALAEVYAVERTTPLFLGAVKTNLGHMEAAAGMAGLIKAALCVNRALIPANLHFRRLNPDISAGGAGFAVPTELTPWPARTGRRIAAVSSFGLSGTNAHMIVGQAPDRPAAVADQRRPLSVLTLSAKTEAALVKLARRYADKIARADVTPVADVCYSANTGRSHFPWRLAAVAGSAADLADRLADYVRGEPGDGLTLGRATGGPESEVVFLFSGAGPQRPGMTRELYQTQPTFQRVVDHCAALLQPVLKAPLLDALYPDDPGSTLIYEVEYVATGMFAVEYALAELWRSWGVEPAAVIGHSLGEYAAACFAGVMPLDEGLRLVAKRARLLEELTEAGVMAAVYAPRDEVALELAGYDPAQISIGAVNGPANIAISGVREAVEAVCAAFTSRGVDVKQLRVPRAGHSPLVEPALAPLRQALEQATFRPPRIPLISDVTGQLWPWDTAPDAEYWCRHTRQPVLFADGLTALYELGYRTFLEIGPAANLLGLAADVLPADGDVTMVPSLRPKQRDWESLLAAVGQLYVRGTGIDWDGFDHDYTRTTVRLPSYPFAPVRCWHEPSADRATVDWRRSPGEAGDGIPAESASVPGPAVVGRDSVIPTAAELLRLPADERLHVLIPALARRAAVALGNHAPSIDVDQPLADFGFDSLMAVELRNEIQGRLQTSLTVANFLSGATIRTVAGQIAAELQGGQQGDTDGTSGGMAIRRVERVEDVMTELLERVEDLPDGPVGSPTDAEREDD